MISVPIKMPYVDGGNLRPRGLARLESDRLVIEYQLFDIWTSKARSDVKVVELPLDVISSIQFKVGLFGDTIYLNAHSMKDLEGLESADQGSAYLKTRRRDRASAQSLVVELDLKLSERLLGRREQG